MKSHSCQREWMRGRPDPAPTLPLCARVDQVTLSTILEETRAWPLERRSHYALDLADTLHGPLRHLFIRARCLDRGFLSTESFSICKVLLNIK